MEKSFRKKEVLLGTKLEETLRYKLVKEDHRSIK